MLKLFFAAWNVVVAVLVAGALWPAIPGVGPAGTLVETWLGLHLFIAAVIGLALAIAASRVYAGLGTKICLALAVFAIVGAAIPLLAILRVARQYQAEISWVDHFRVMGREPSLPRHPNQTVGFGPVDGQTLYADIYLPEQAPRGKSALVVMLHGGGYIHGKRSMPNEWDRWLAERGYTVFDVDYRLAPPPTWHQAAQDVACAMGWIAANAATYDVDPRRMLVAGQSAGAGLALQVAYGIGDGTVKSSCGGSPPEPAAVFALYPPDDFALGWSQNTKLGTTQARRLLQEYLGGSPQEFPERYRAVSAVEHVRAGLPPMLIAAGEHDHLVPYRGHVELVEELNRAGVPHVFLTIPYADHAYDVAWGSLGTQITRQVVGDFLAKYLPATTSN